MSQKKKRSIKYDEGRAIGKEEQISENQEEEHNKGPIEEKLKKEVLQNKRDNSNYSDNYIYEERERELFEERRGEWIGIGNSEYGPERS